MSVIKNEFPKVELHLHLEGSTSAATLIKLAKSGRTKNSLPVMDEQKLEEMILCKDFDTFWTVWSWFMDLWLDPENLAVMVTDYLETAATYNVKYVDITTGVIMYTRRYGLPVWKFLDSITYARNEAFKKWGIRSSVSLAFNRGYPELNSDIMGFSVKAFEKGLANSISLVGDEKNAADVVPFKDAFQYARDAGLKISAHAGEWAGPESIWNTLKILQPDRIGHGIRAVEDSELVIYLAENEIPLEVCPTSNVCTGVYRCIEEHPLPVLLKHGVKVSVSSDDPALFGTNMGKEYEILEKTFGFSPDEILKITLNAVDASFLNTNEKKLLRNDVFSDFDKLSFP